MTVNGQNVLALVGNENFDEYYRQDLLILFQGFPEYRVAIVSLPPMQYTSYQL